MGPVGSSKTSALCAEIYKRACLQAPDAGRVRPTRWAFLRNTYPELKSTTIKTWLEWFPHTVMKWDSPITGKLDFWLPDKTRVQAEIEFRALERPEDIDAISSLELTGAAMNEVREMAKAIMDKLTERVGRYPKLKRVPPTWRGVMMDTNPPPDDHWYYKLAEKDDAQLIAALAATEHKLRELGYLREGQPLMEFFKQPGGLIEENGIYGENPLAENIANLDGGYAYYFRQIPGKDSQWIKSQILGQYASYYDGRRVYEGYNDALHCKEVWPIEGVPLLVGMDYGLSPAATLCQVLPDGRLHVLDEITADDADAVTFAEDYLKPHLAQFYTHYTAQYVGDPAGVQRAQSNAKTVFEALASVGILAAPAKTNDPTARWNAVKHYLGRMVNGQPAFAMSPKCRNLRRGFNGGYFFERVQVNSGQYRDFPKKNQYSHPHDALQYACLWAQSYGAGAKSEPIKYPKLHLV
jgi:hypothetical protein